MTVNYLMASSDDGQLPHGIDNRLLASSDDGQLPHGSLVMAVNSWLLVMRVNYLMLLVITVNYLMASSDDGQLPHGF